MEQVKYVYSIGCSYTGGTGLENYKDRFELNIVLFPFESVFMDIN